MTCRLGWGTYRCADDITRTAVTMVAAGVDWIDTAPNYGDGHAQTALAPVLANKPQVMVSTKVGYVPGPLRAAAVRAGVLPDSAQTTGYCIDAAYVRWQIHRNLAELGRDRVEVMFLHNPEHLTMSGSGLKERISAAFAELETAARGGLIDGYGIATWHGFHGHFTIADLVHAAYAAGGLDHHLIAVQLPVSLIEIRHLAEALERRGPLIDAARAGLRVFASAPLGGGRLPGMVGPELASLVGRGLSGAEAALAVAASAPNVERVLLSTRSRAHWQQATAVLDATPLDTPTLRKIVDVLT